MPASLTERIRAPFLKDLGGALTKKLGLANGLALRGLNVAGSEVIDLIGTDTNNKLRVGGAYARGNLTPLSISILTTAKITTTPLFCNNDADTMELAGISCSFATANGSALTAYVSKELATSLAPGAGSTCMSGTFNLNATANTVQDATLAGTRGYPTLVIKPGEQLSLKLSTTTTSLAGLVITLWFRNAIGPMAVYTRSANGDIADGTMFLSPIDGMKIRKIAMRWGTAGTDGGAVTAQVEKDTTTGAPAGGTIVQAAAQSVKGTTNYTVFPALSTTASDYTMTQADRLSVDMVGTLTALANLVITVFFEPLSEDWLIIPFSTWDDPDGEKDVFIANDFYQLVGFYATWSTAAGGSTSLTLEKCTGTTAPAGGTAMLASTIDTSGTANTPVIGVPLTTNPFTVCLKATDRISLEHTGTTAALAGLFGVIVLQKI